jgi:cytochrome c biogenesis protein CcmG, thiol:disulfide interchange protein DsbE
MQDTGLEAPRAPMNAAPARPEESGRLSRLLATKLGGRIFTAIALILAGAVIIAFAIPSYRQGEPGIAGKRADDFAFDLNGRQTHLSDFRGKVVVLNFWASWCPPCVAEVDSLSALQRDISSRGGVVLGVSIDEDPDAYQQFLAEHHVSFPTFRDPSQKIAGEYGTAMWPETYIIGTDGRIARKIVAQQDWDGPELEGYVESLLPRSGKS